MNHHSDTELDKIFNQMYATFEKDGVFDEATAKLKLLKLIDKEVTRNRNIAKDEVLDDLVEWSELWASMHKEPFNWYGAVKALKIAKDHQKPFNTLAIQEEGTDNE